MKPMTVAYFSAEYAIADDMPIYAGGLGVLAADMLLEAGAQGRSFAAVGLVYHMAFTGDDPDQRPMKERLEANGFALATEPGGKQITVSVLVAGRRVALRAWVKHWGDTQLILLDANLHENLPMDRAICDRLYASDLKLQLAQEICLGFGGVAMLDVLGVKPDVYHLNEGHTALAGLAVALMEAHEQSERTLSEAVAAVKHKLVGTKHTILPGAGILLDWHSVTGQMSAVLESYGVSIEELKEIAGLINGDYSDTKLMIKLTRLASGVSEIHVAEELSVHKNSQLITITNGIFRPRWASPIWGDQPLELSDAEIWDKHCQGRRKLLEMANEHTDDALDPDALTVVWARRMAAYKRPELLVTDLKRLAEVASAVGRPIQFVVAGRANPADAIGVELMKRVVMAAQSEQFKHRLAYLPAYNPATAKLLVQGADVWLNTPIRGYEACGTSGMKASLNGAVQFSTSDGWIDEIELPRIGWELPVKHAAKSLYDLLEAEIAPKFYDRGDDGLPHEWIKLMRANIELISKQFTATRMLDDYYSKLYAPAVDRA